MTLMCDLHAATVEYIGDSAPNRARRLTSRPPSGRAASASNRSAWDQIKAMELTARAWALKESLRQLWDYHGTDWAKRFWQRSYFWSTHSRLSPMVKAARLIARHPSNVLWRSQPLSGSSDSHKSRMRRLCLVYYYLRHPMNRIISNRFRYKGSGGLTEKAIVLVDTATGRALGPPFRRVKQGEVSRLEFSPDGTRLLSVGDEVAVWLVDPWQWLRRSCAVLDVGIDAAEWEKRLPGIPRPTGC